MRTLKLLLITIVLLFSHCKKNPPPVPNYTVTGKFLNGTTNQPLYVGQQIQLEVRTGIQYPNFQSAILGTCTVNDTGGFSFTYPQTSITYGGAYIRLDMQLSHYGNFPVNQNVNQTIYFSSLGSIKIYMFTKTSLQSTDTLFFAYQDFNLQIHFDTIRNTIDGYYKTIRTPPM